MSRRLSCSLSKGRPRYINRCLEGKGCVSVKFCIRAFSSETLVSKEIPAKVSRPSLSSGEGERTCKSTVDSCTGDPVREDSSEEGSDAISRRSYRIMLNCIHLFLIQHRRLSCSLSQNVLHVARSLNAPDQVRKFRTEEAI